MKQFSFKWLALFATTLLFAPACGGDDNGGPSTPKQLNVEASASPEDGSAPLEVTFTATPQFVRGQGDNMNVVNDDISENEDLNLEYSWDFGDDSEAGEGMEATHTYNEPGAYTAEVTLTQTFEGDREDRTATGEVVVNVEAPEFTVSVDSSAEEVRVGEGVTFTCNLDTDLSTDLFDFEWSFDEQGLSASTQETTKSFSTVGAKQVTCEATLGDKTQSGSTSVDVLENPTPTVNALNPNPRTGIASLEVNFNPSVTYGGDKANLSYEWSFGDGGSSTEQAPTYTYENPGSYTATLTVVDPDGDTNSATADIEVTTDEQPAVAIATPSQPVEGISPVTVDFSAEVSGGNQPVDLEWDYGDGSDVDTIDEPTHTFESSDGDSTYTVTVTATDANGDTATDTVDVTAIQDQPINSVTLSPVAAGTDTDTLEPRNVQMECAVDGGNAPFTYEWDFGDGSTKTTQTNTTTHTYTDATAAGGAPFTATCTATDADGDTGSGSEEGIQVTEDTQPSIQAVTANPAQASITANSSVDVDFDSTVSGGNAPLTYEWDFKNGNMGTGATATATYSNAGTYGVQLTVTDNDGDVATDSVTVSIAEGNTPPSPDLTLSQSCGYPEYITNQGTYEATEVTIDASGSSDADGDTISYDFEVIGPNGSSVKSVDNSPSPTATFTPATLGEHTVYLTVDDGDATTQAQTTFSSSLTQDIDFNSSSLSGQVNSSPSTQVEAVVTNDCGTELEGIAVEWSGDNVTAQASDGIDASRDLDGSPGNASDDSYTNVDAYTDSDGKVTTLVTLGKDSGDAALTASTFDNAGLNTDKSYIANRTEQPTGVDSFEEADFLAEQTQTHTVNPGAVANVIIQDRAPIEVSGAVQGQGGQITFQAADRYLNPINDNDVAVEFDAMLRDSGNTDASDNSDTSSNLGSVGFLADSGNASDGPTKTLTIEEGEGTTSATIFSDTVSTGVDTHVYVTVDGDAGNAGYDKITDTDGNNLPGDNGNFGFGAAEIDLASEDFEDAEIGSGNWVDPSAGSGLPANNGEAGDGTYFEIGQADAGPGSADTGSNVLATNPAGDYDADWDQWNKDATGNSADDYTETLTATWDHGDDQDGGIYPYDNFGVHEMDLSYRVWFDTPTGLNNKSDSTFASAVVNYLDGGTNYEELGPDNIAYTGLELWGHLDGDANNNSSNWTQGDYRNTPSAGTKQFIRPTNTLNNRDWTNGYAGQSDGWIAENLSFEVGSSPLDGTFTDRACGSEPCENFADISGDQLEFAFRVELDERLSDQPTGAGLYVDSLDVDAVTEALPVEFSRTTEPGAVSFESKQNGFDVVADETVAGWVEYSVEDDFGNDVASGVEFTIRLDGSQGINDDAEFLNQIGEDSNGNNIGTLVSHSADEVTVETNSEGEARVLVAADNTGNVYTEAEVNNPSGSNFTSTDSSLQFFQCLSTTEACQGDTLDLTTAPTSDDDDVRYREGNTWSPPVNGTSGNQAWDDRAGNLDPADDDVWVHQNALANDNDDNVTDDLRDFYNPNGAEDDCSGLDTDLNAADRIYPVTPASNNDTVGFRLLGLNSFGGTVGFYLVSNLSEPVDSCVTGTEGSVGTSTNIDLILGDASGAGPTSTSAAWSPDNTDTHYLIVDTNEDSQNQDINKGGSGNTDAQFDLQVRVHNE